MLEATAMFAPKARFYNAASSEMYGNTPDFPINENSRMLPRLMLQQNCMLTI